MAFDNNNSTLTEGTMEAREVAGAGEEQAIETEREVGTESRAGAEGGDTEAPTADNLSDTGAETLEADEAKTDEAMDEENASVLDQMNEDELRALGDDMLKYVTGVLSLTKPPQAMIKAECGVQPDILRQICGSGWLEYVSTIVAKSSQPEGRMVALGVKSLQHSINPVEQCEALRLGGVNEILSILVTWRDLQDTLAVLREARKELYNVTALLDKFDTRVPHYDIHVSKTVIPCATCSDYPSGNSTLGKWIQVAQAEIASCLGQADDYIDRLDGACGEILEGCRCMLIHWFEPYPGMDLHDVAFYRFFTGADVSDNFTHELRDLLALRESLVDRTDYDEWNPLLSAVSNYIAENIKVLFDGSLNLLVNSCEGQINACNDCRVLIGDITRMFCDTLDVLHDRCAN